MSHLLFGLALLLLVLHLVNNLAAVVESPVPYHWIGRQHRIWQQLAASNWNDYFIQLIHSRNHQKNRYTRCNMKVCQSLSERKKCRKKCGSYLRWSSRHWYFVTIWRRHLGRCSSNIVENWRLICWRRAVASWILRCSGIRIGWRRSDHEMLLRWHLSMGRIWWRRSSIVHWLHLWYRTLNSKTKEKKKTNRKIKIQTSSTLWIHSYLFFIDSNRLREWPPDKNVDDVAAAAAAALAYDSSCNWLIAVDLSTLNR